MKNNQKRSFKCTFKVLKINNQYEIREIWFTATTREGAKNEQENI